MTRRRHFQFAVVAEAEICTFFHTLPQPVLLRVLTQCNMNHSPVIWQKPCWFWYHHKILYIWMLLYVCYVLVSSQLLGTSQKYFVPRMFIIISTDILPPHAALTSTRPNTRPHQHFSHLWNHHFILPSICFPAINPAFSLDLSYSTAVSTLASSENPSWNVVFMYVWCVDDILWANNIYVGPTSNITLPPITSHIANKYKQHIQQTKTTKLSYLI